MRRESHVRFCEGGGVRFPSATRRNVYVKSKRAAERVMASKIYGLMAEFDDASALVLAAGSAREAGYRRMDAYSPFPIEELHHALGSHHSRLPLIWPSQTRSISFRTLGISPSRTVWYPRWHFSSMRRMAPLRAFEERMSISP